MSIISKPIQLSSDFQFASSIAASITQESFYIVTPGRNRDSNYLAVVDVSTGVPALANSLTKQYDSNRFINVMCCPYDNDNSFNGTLANSGPPGQLSTGHITYASLEDYGFSNEKDISIYNDDVGMGFYTADYDDYNKRICFGGSRLFHNGAPEVFYVLVNTTVGDESESTSIHNYAYFTPEPKPVSLSKNGKVYIQGISDKADSVILCYKLSTFKYGKDIPNDVSPQYSLIETFTLIDNINNLLYVVPVTQAKTGGSIYYMDIKIVDTATNDTSGHMPRFFTPDLPLSSFIDEQRGKIYVICLTSIMVIDAVSQKQTQTINIPLSSGEQIIQAQINRDRNCILVAATDESRDSPVNCYVVYNPDQVGQ